MAQLECMEKDKNVCADVRFELEPIKPDHFAEMKPALRKAKFIAWLSPLAKYVQAQTGFPASVLIGQAALASDWGNAPGFRSHRNLFDHACWDDSVLKGEFQLAGQPLAYAAVCKPEKTKAYARKLYEFSKFEESAAAYLYFVMISKSRHFKPIQEELERLKRPREATGVSSYRTIVHLLESYSHDPNYRSALTHAIDMEKLNYADADPCQKCLFNKRRVVVPQ